MNFYVQSLFIAVPSFIILIIIEMIVSRIKGIKVNEPEDMISSLSSGITNTTKSAFKIGIVLVSYTWLVDNITIYKLFKVLIIQQVFLKYLNLQGGLRNDKDDY